MGLFDRFRTRTSVDVATWQAADAPDAWWVQNDEFIAILGMTEAEMWRTQPYLRMVVDFLARNGAQLGLQTFQRVSENDRQRVRTGGIADALARPNGSSTAYELIYSLFADLGLYDRAHWLIAGDPNRPIVRLPVPWVQERGGDMFGPEEYWVRKDAHGRVAVIPAEQVITFHGWHPRSLSAGSSPVHALKEILAEQVMAAKYRRKVWERGGKVGSVLSRPAGAPQWSDDARRQFKADWDASFTGDGDRVGGTPLLEDGMALNRVDFSAHEMEFIEGARLALNTVASVFHIPPPMVGLLDNANYSNVREFRKMLYGDTLGPVLAQIEDRINTFVVPMLDDRDGIYVEFNIDEKLQGNFEEQAAALQTAVGAPWMSRDEARALRNMPAIPGGDQLVTPLNVLIGGQASPTDSGTQNQGPKDGEAALLKWALAESRAREAAAFAATKAVTTEAQREQVTRVLKAFMERQGKSVLSAIGSGGEDWWDGERWDRELTDDLTRVSHTIASILGKAEAERLGYPDGYDPDRTVEFLQTVMGRKAANINETTRKHVEAQLAADGGDPATVYSGDNVATRAGVLAAGLGTFLGSFGTGEAARQIAYDHGGSPTKTWITGSNPRPSHASVSGETVGIDEPFSNGCMWPGDGADVDEVAGCNCAVDISF